jgi:hypothetical protein
MSLQNLLGISLDRLTPWQVLVQQEDAVGSIN